MVKHLYVQKVHSSLCILVFNWICNHVLNCNSSNEHIGGLLHKILYMYQKALSYFNLKYNDIAYMIYSKKFAYGRWELATTWEIWQNKVHSFIIKFNVNRADGGQEARALSSYEPQCNKP